MGITGLLALTFLLGTIVQEVPRSKKLPLLGILYLFYFEYAQFLIFSFLPKTRLFLYNYAKKPILTLFDFPGINGR